MKIIWAGCVVLLPALGDIGFFLGDSGMKTWLEFLCLVKFFIWIVFRGYLSCYDSQVRLHTSFSRIVCCHVTRVLVVDFFMALIMGIMLWVLIGNIHTH